MRFNHKLFTHSDAVKNSLILFDAAKKAGVERIVHVSITNPSSEINLEYFQGKAFLEKALIETGLSYSILRPAVLFGKEDILINNIAWALRKFPVFGVFGDGNYGIQPIYIDDFAKLAVNQGEVRENNVINAVGPESFSYKELVKTIGRIIGKNRTIISVHPLTGYIFATIVGWLVRAGQLKVLWQFHKSRSMLDKGLRIFLRIIRRVRPIGTLELAEKNSA